MNVSVPLLFKDAVDQLSAVANAASTSTATTDAAATVATAAASGGIPLTLSTGACAVLLGYGIARATASLTNELRSALFARVTSRGITLISVGLFRHLLSLDARFHMERNTGALSRSIDRGTRSINLVFTTLAFNVIPTLLEIGLVLGILSYSGGIEFAGIASATLIVYVVFTVMFSQWRTKFRQQMNRHVYML